MKRSREFSDESDEGLDEYEMMEHYDEMFLNACEEGDLKRVEGLLKLRKSDVDAKDDMDERSGIHFAALNGHIDVVILLLEYGADVNAAMDGNLTALHLTARDGDVDMVKLLIQNDADVNAVTDQNKTAGFIETNDCKIHRGTD